MKKRIVLITIVAALLMTAKAMAEFYVIPVGPRYKHPEVVSAYLNLEGAENGSAYTIMSVPAGKCFMLTDIMDNNSRAFQLAEDDRIKMEVPLDPGGTYRPPVSSLHLNTGIPFGPGTQVNLIVIYGYGTHRVTITGYLIDN